jgi:SNF2 family DNA or RNA helicase
MLRRLKKDVLTQLPDKQRQKIMIETNKNITKEINALIDQNGSNPMNKPEDIIMEMFGFRNESFGTHGDR